MLLQEEQYVVNWLAQYGALPRYQVVRMLQKPAGTAEKILKNLLRRGQVEEISGGYYLGLDSMCKPDQRTILAVWVLLKFIRQVEPMAHYPAVHRFFRAKEPVRYTDCGLIYRHI